MCTVVEMKRPDDINDVDGETSVRQYVCTVQSVECRYVDSVGSDAIGREAANQKIQIRCNTTQEISLTGGGDTHASRSFRRNVKGRGDRVTIPAILYLYLYNLLN